MTVILETPRLRLRELQLDDAAFILDLVNQPSWLRNIGDKGVRTLADAENYIRTGPMAMYARHGFGLYRLELRDSGVAIGMCGLIKRDTLDDVDVGYALHPDYWRQGYASEAVTATLAWGHARFGLQRIVAIVSPHNEESIRVLERAGFAFEKMIQMSPDAEPIKFFGRNFAD